MKKYFLFLLFFFILLISNAEAKCLNISAQGNYLAGETIEVEITANIIKPLTYNDINFYYDSKEYFPSFSLSQLASNKWILFMDAPSKYGQNTISLEKLVCRENGTLKEETSAYSFSVKKPVQDYYISFVSKLEDKWDYFSTEEIAQSLIALELINYDSAFIEDGKNALLKKGNECWPSANCSVKSTALALLALQDRAPEKAKDWLYNSRNSVSEGLWTFTSESGSAQTCAVYINNLPSNLTLQAGTNSFSLALPNVSLINISSNCPNPKILQTISGRVNEIPLGIISNEKCYGSGYKTKCDILSTFYALKINPDKNVENWMVANAKTTEEIAFAYIAKNNSNQKGWLVNNQHETGYWSANGLAVSAEPDAKSTIAAAIAINNQNSEEWLRSNIDSFSLEELALTLQLLSSKIEPVVSFQGAIQNVVSSNNLSIKFYNKGIFPLVLKLSLLGTSLEKELPAKTALTFSMKVPVVSETTFTSLVAETKLGSSRIYSIPVIAFPSAQAKTETNVLNLTVEKPVLNLTSPKSLSSSNATNSNVSSSVQSNASKTQIKTTQVSSSKLNFESVDMNLSLKPGENSSFQLTLKNSYSEKVTAYLSVWGLSDIVSNFPSSVELEPNSEETITFSLNPKYSMTYDGEITAETNGESVRIPVYIRVRPAASNKTCSELKGRICPQSESCVGRSSDASDGLCCLDSCKKPVVAGTSSGSKKLIGIIMIVLAVLSAAAFIFFKMREKKRPASIDKVLEKIRAEAKSESTTSKRPSELSEKDFAL